MTDNHDVLKIKVEYRFLIKFLDMNILHVYEIN